MSSSKIKKNLVWQIFYQILNAIIPLITSPYISRVLGAEQLGVFSYAQSIVNYFALIAMMGIGTYGIRLIAPLKNEKEKMSGQFWSVFLLQLFFSIASISLYSVYLIAFCRDNKLIAFIQAIEILSCLVNISWLFFGLEEFKTTVIFSSIVRTLSVVLIILLVKKESDLWLYTLIIVSSSLGSHALLWIKLCKLVTSPKKEFICFKPHFKPIFTLFIPIAAMSVYHSMDKTMLGLLSTYSETGYYYNADKVINIPLGIISGITTVLMPKASKLIASSEKEEVISLFNKSLEGIVLVSVALSFGIAAVAVEFVPVFFGDGYEPCVLLIYLFVPVFIIKSFSFLVRYVYIIPAKKDKIYIYSIFAGALVNLIANLILIPRYGAIGATIGTLIAEFVACVLQFALIWKDIKCGISLLKSSIYLVFAAVMFASVRAFSLIFKGGLLSLILEILVGALVFLFFVVLWFLIVKKNNLFREIKDLFKKDKQQNESIN